MTVMTSFHNEVSYLLLPQNSFIDNLNPINDGLTHLCLLILRAKKIFVTRFYTVLAQFG
jgi:hypothetical protein